MTEQATQVPLTEQLESVPANARLVIDDHANFQTTSYPVGRISHQAAAELRRLHSVNAQLLEALECVLENYVDDDCYGLPAEKARAAIAAAKGEA